MQSSLLKTPGDKTEPTLPLFLLNRKETNNGIACASDIGGH